MAAIVIVLVVVALLGLVTGVMQWAAVKLTGVVLPTLNTEWGQIGLDLDVLNAFVPLAEGVAMIYALLTISLVVITVRWVKSFVPTVSN